MADLTVGQPRWEKRYLFEIEPAFIIHTSSWTLYSANAWWMSFLLSPTKVEEWDSTKTPKLKKYEEVASAALCESTASSWFWDSATDRLYVHTRDADKPSVKVSG